MFGRYITPVDATIKNINVVQISTAFVVSKEENSFMLINSSEESSVPHAFPNSHFKKNLNLHLDILIN